MAFQRRRLQLNPNIKSAMENDLTAHLAATNPHPQYLLADNYKPSNGKSIFEVFFTASTTPPPGAVPLWTGEWLTNCASVYPTFYQTALAYQTNGSIRTLTNDQYESELSTYGECGAFVIQGNDIRLPKITRFIGSLDVVGDIGVTKNDMLVDHTHSYSFTQPDENSKGLGDGVRGASALQTSQTSETKSISGTTSASVGDEIQPKHIRFALYIQVYNATVNEALIDISALAQQISDLQNQIAELRK